ncbi:CocE/NonD family hydrolase [Streptomyces sp. NPDC002889]|uniref:CocE/NonD family hydrolase n=1 Tax=Streptomyces sp. NPDC002889 TaxID=3364669 RepID=UPI0036C5BC55
MRIRTEFPYKTAHEDLRIPLPDGITLYARIWRPVTDEPVPALLEYVPHRLTDGTAARDAQRHPWYAGHGYASVRVDVRGHGNSEGLPGDECDATEIVDGAEVIEWLAGQPWCSGRVGMFGLGRGGRSALRIAALAPWPLKAVVTVCASDDPYDNDGLHLGGAVSAAGLHARAAALLAGTVRPPDPLFTGESWRTLWLKRLEALTPYVHTWLGHQLRDEHWRHAALPEDHTGIEAAVLAVGGWHEPHRDTVLRLVSRLPRERVRGLIGPWPHQYPDTARPPGPAIGFLQETLRWWDHWLKADSDSASGAGATGVMAEPLLRSWIGAAHPPATAYAEPPGGRWVGDDVWPSPHITLVPYGLGGAPVLVHSPQHTGVDAGRLRPVGQDADLPPDQREEDARSACFEFPVGDEAIDILGRPQVTLRLRLDVPHGQAVARICDVAPDGAATLVTRGVLDMAARHGRERCDAWTPGETEEVGFELSAMGHTFPPGHRIRLAVSCAYWPWVWPRAGSAGFTLDPEGSRLELPVRERTTDTIAFEDPEHAEPLGVSIPVTLDKRRPALLVTRDVAEGEWRLECDPGPGGTQVFPDGLEFTEQALETYTIHEDDPLSAGARSDWTIRLHRPELSWDVRIETHSDLTCDHIGFRTRDEVVCRDGDEIVFHRTWEKRVPRVTG